MYRILALFLLVMLDSVSAQAVEVAPSNVDGAGCEPSAENVTCITLYVHGKIERGDADKIRQKIEAVDDFKDMVNIGLISLDSTGGDVREAMKIGRLFREKLLTVWVARNSKCYSSCVISLLGGVARLSMGEIGIHSFYSPEYIGSGKYKEASKVYDEISSALEAYMKEMRIPIALLDEDRKSHV